MSTNKLYYEDAYQLAFAATVTEDTEIDKKPAVVLDQSLFYPESGGQPADSGELNGIAVLDVQERGEDIIHILKESIPKGSSVKGEVDFGKRWDHMQQHSGQHILSQSFLQLLQANTIAFHLGREFSTIDLDKDGLNQEDCFRVEVLANRIVLENRPIASHHLTRDKAATLPIRRIPEDQENLRIIEIEGFDLNACCGTHVKATGEVGQIKISGTERYKGGTRVSFLCGWRALKDYQAKQTVLQSLRSTLSVGEAEMHEAISRWATERKESSKQIRKLKQQLDTYLIRELSERAETISSIQVITETFENENAKSKQALLQTLIRNPNTVVLFGMCDQDRAYLLFGRSKDIDLDLRPVLKSASEIIDGRGGGSDSFAQASGNNCNQIDKALETAKIAIETGLNKF